MPVEHIGNYDVEYAGVRLAADSSHWAATLTIYGPSCNPMHRHAIFPCQRVLPELVFDDERAAQQEARKAALEMLRQH